MEILIPPLVLGGLGMVLGLLIFFVGKYFGVQEDHRIDELEKRLPRYNCGACGFAGCRDLSKAMLEGKATPDGCKPIKPEDKVLLNQFLAELLRTKTEH